MDEEAADADGPAVFTFDRDGNLSAFPTLAFAAAWMEAIDVDDDEYEAVYTIDGRIVQASTANEAVILTVTARHDKPDLRRRLDEIRVRDGLLSPVDNTVGIANELMRREWENRWPRWPRWLPRLGPSKGPAQITPPQE